MTQNRREITEAVAKRYFASMRYSYPWEKAREPIKEAYRERAAQALDFVLTAMQEM